MIVDAAWWFADQEVLVLASRALDAGEGPTVERMPRVVDGHLAGKMSTTVWDPIVPRRIVRLSNDTALDPRLRAHIVRLSNDERNRCAVEAPLIPS